MYTTYPRAPTRPHRSQHTFTGAFRPPLYRRTFHPAPKDARSKSDDIEEATRAHVKAHQEYEETKAKYEDFKRKCEDAKRRLEEAAKRLDSAKRRGKDW